MMKHMTHADAKTPEVDVAQNAQACADQSSQIVDVREPIEWASGHIAGALHMPLGDLTSRIDELDRSRPVITICRSGHRSLAAADALIERGFTASSMTGGVLAWQKAKQPVER